MHLPEISGGTERKILHFPQISRSGASAIVFWSLLALTLAIRIPVITQPLLGNFATKQCVYAMIARNWVEGRASLLTPCLDVLVGGEPSLHLLEVPVSAYLAGIGWWLAGGSLDAWGRGIALVFSSAAAIVLFLWLRREQSTKTAAAAGLTLVLSPVALVYGASFMLEASLTFCLVSAGWSASRWARGGGVPWLAALLVSTALLLLTKIYMAVMLLPLAWTLWAARNTSLPGGSTSTSLPAGPASATEATLAGPRADSGVGPSAMRTAITRSAMSTRVRIALGLFALGLAALPAVGWCGWAWRISKGEQADHVYYSLRQSSEVHRFPHPLLGQPDFYREVLYDLAGRVLTPVGLLLLLVGAGARRARPYLPWLVAAGLLVAALPMKFREMNYYYLAILPGMALVIGLGWQRICDRMPPSLLGNGMLLLLVAVFAIRYAGGPLGRLAIDDRSVLSAGQAVERWSNAEDRVVAMHGTSIDLLYYCNRRGWAVDPLDPAIESRLAKCRHDGAKFVAVAAASRPWSLPPSMLAEVDVGEGYWLYRFR